MLYISEHQTLWKINRCVCIMTQIHTMIFKWWKHTSLKLYAAMITLILGTMQTAPHIYTHVESLRQAVHKAQSCWRNQYCISIHKHYHIWHHQQCTGLSNIYVKVTIGIMCMLSVLTDLWLMRIIYCVYAVVKSPNWDYILRRSTEWKACHKLKGYYIDMNEVKRKGIVFNLRFVCKYDDNGNRSSQNFLSSSTIQCSENRLITSHGSLMWVKSYLEHFFCTLLNNLVSI